MGHLLQHEISSRELLSLSIAAYLSHFVDMPRKLVGTVRKDSDRGTVATEESIVVFNKFEKYLALFLLFIF